MDIKMLQKLLNEYFITDNYYLINNKYYYLDEILDLCKKKYGYKPNNRYKSLKKEQILELISQEKTNISSIRTNYITEKKKKKCNEMDNLYFSILNEKKKFFNESEKRKKEDENQLLSKYNEALNKVKENFLKLNQNLKILNESLQKYYYIKYRNDYETKINSLNDFEQTINRKKEEDFQKRMKKIDDFKEEIRKNKINNYSNIDYKNNHYNINFTNNNNNYNIKKKLEVLKNNNENEIMQIRDNFFKFDFPYFIDKINCNFINDIKNLISIAFNFNSKEHFKNKFSKEKQLIINNNKKRKIIENKFKDINNLIYNDYDNQFENNKKECISEMIGQYKNYCQNKNISIFENKIIEIYKEYKNKFENLENDLNDIIEKEKKNLTNELNKIDNNNTNNINNINNNKNNFNLKSNYNINKSNNFNFTKENISQPKIFVPQFKRYQETDINYKEIYKLKTINGITCYNVGLINLGNTCFMNSCIQCLRHCFGFTNYILNELNPNKSISKVSYYFKNLMKNLFSNIKSTNPIDFRNSLGDKYPIYLTNSQKDSLRFFLHLINTLNDEYISLNKIRNNDSENKISSQSENQSESLSNSQSESQSEMKSESQSESPSEDENENKTINKEVINNEIMKMNKKKNNFFSKNKTKINDLFVGFLIYEIEYLCSHHKIEQSFRSYNCLNVSIIDSNNFNKIDKLENCIGAYIKDIKLEGNNKLYCSKCKKKVKAKSRVKITDFPEILVINLKRLDGNNYYSHYVDYPINLDLTKYIYNYGDKADKPLYYTLKSLIQHYGDNNGGHKVAICRNFSNKNWYQFSDDIVNQIDDTKIFSFASHLLFYEKCNKFTYIEPTHQLAQKEISNSYEYAYNNNSFFQHNQKKKQNFAGTSGFVIYQS